MKKNFKEYDKKIYYKTIKKCTTRAGVSWSLTYRGKSDQGFLVYNVGRDSPYYTFADGEKYRTPTLFERNGVTEIQGPGYALYKKGEPINPAGQSPGIKKNNFKERVFIKNCAFFLTMF